ncbi:ATP-binding SpoIIE family protein phosphatase [Actinacidiphila acididurans]|uniref:SpoIIE family protein phosphatase n=1 Tax=Actinacidiphila acididurans TaxID=2784346 RepID=A0ABS2TV51_9ACTN|nr:SpoIIE family protein phosphatase [Actinacidiphila acididurans]MBM9505838.1 SpoIIE family protein phosphatase [Actinacidiphila acididurans]
MRTEDVLAAVGYGLWQWDESTGTVTVDGRAARLLELSGGAATHRSSAVRERLHAADYVALAGAVSLATAEGTVAESVLRVTGDDGSVRRTVRARLRRQGPLLSGSLHEVRPGRPGEQAAPAGGRRQVREAFLLDAGRALAEADSTAEVLRVAAGLSLPGFSPDGLAVFGLDGDRLALIGRHGRETVADGPFTQMPLTTDYPAALVVRTGQAVYLPTPEEYEKRFPDTWPLTRPFGRSSWAFLPLTVAGTTIGAWLAAFREPVEFTPDERSVLTTVARMLAQALSRAQVQESERAMPDGPRHAVPPVSEPGIDGMKMAARYVPTGGGLQVGGDWYDVIDLPSGRTAIVIGDVQGHDVRAAGIMGQLRIALRAYAAEGHGPDAVMSRTSRFLAALDGHRDPSEIRFATCMYVEVDPATGTLDLVRAGHPEPAVRLGDGSAIVRRTPGGLPLGIDPDADYRTTRLVLEPGEVLMLCTDGLIETGGHDLETGWSRLTGVLEAGPAHDLEALADAMVRAVHGPGSHHTTGPLADRREDDIALVLLRRDPDGPTCAMPSRRTVITVPQDEPAAIKSARDDIRALLHDWASDDQRESAVLLVSELVANVLVHTDADALLAAELTGLPGVRRLHVEVADSSDEMPHRRSPGEMASSGRGLLLLEELADCCGVNPRGDGKCIWFDFVEPPTSAPPGEPAPGEPRAAA